ncbi:HAD-IC family P-type ATPase [Pseudonocardia sp. C8]|uniref:HAD-IC family P-type ATPase n=1 Tax=Pseudonocardia sp. C8 TaxID=2762759 RepID=UPI0016434210|nr:HAD-IC family P-type ATPase [Pseudonocardia sp. C8]MBC3194503.1 HAD-IC family P-type ATPase [Pseudonocardia sp. C8]
MWQRLIDAAAGTIGTVVGVAAGAAELVTTAATGAVSAAPGRVHVRMRGVHLPGAADRVEEVLLAHEAVHRVEVNAVLGDVLVEFDPERVDGAAAIRLVRDAERTCELTTAPHASPDHPADPGTVLREATLAGLNAVGMLAAAVGTPRVRAPIGFPLSVLPHVDASPALRAAFTKVLGEPLADPLLGGIAAFSNTTGRRPVGLLVDGVHRAARHTEARARRRSWTEWETGLAGRAGSHRATAVPAGPRPVPLPPGPVEKVADRAAVATLAGSAALLAATGATPLVDAALSAGLPKAARAGREAYAARLGRDAAVRGCLVLDSSALRRLDRVDTIVLDAGILQTGRHAVDAVLPLTEDSGAEHSELVERAHDLADPHRPGRRRGRDGWSIGPIGRAPAAAVAARAAELADRSSRVLVLRHGDEPVAVVGVSETLDPFAEAVVAAAGESGLVLIGGPADLVRRSGGDGAVPGGAALAGSVRELQRTGHVVALIGGRDAALAAADVGIGIGTPGSRPPWGADVLVRDPGEACLLLGAVGPARQASLRAAQLAVAGSGLGALLAVLGPPGRAAARAAVAVHAAALCAQALGTWSAMAVARRPAPIAADRTPWHAMSPRVVLDTLNSSRTGLAEAEWRRRSRERPRQVGPEELGLVRASVDELANPITTTLTAGAGVSAATGSLLDPMLIIFVLGVNALIGGVQRVSADSALRTLHHSSATRVRVRRGAADEDRTTDELVDGDVIRLQAGDSVPADCRVLSAHDLEVDESSMTGESVPAAKSPQATGARTVADRHCMLYEGTTVAAGRGDAVVVATGDRTEAGRVLRANGDQAPPTGVETRLRELTARILPVSVGAGLALIVVDLLRRRPATAALTRAVSLAVAAVPEGLPFVATVAELAAARRLSRRGALVRNPSTIEALGRVNVLCFDKTGTLTEGRISLRRVSDGTRTATVDEPLPPGLQDVVAAAVRASPFRADPARVPHQTDRAVLRGAHTLGITADHGQTSVELLDELPFESHRGYHAVLWRGRAGNRISVKGAPEVVLPLCSTRHRHDDGTRPFGTDDRGTIDAEIHRLAGEGHRVLAVAERPAPDHTRLADADVEQLEFHGLVAMVDPVRPTAAQSVATLRGAGVETVMITGDHPSTAESIAAELDSVNGRTVVTGPDLDEMSDAELSEALPRIAVYARVSPAQKARIVRLYQADGHPVAVTGDGTNDAPAIRLADVGIALGTHATPAAREAADLVVTDDRIETITDAIVEGRGMWSSVRDALSILLGGNLGEVAYTVGTALFGGTATLNARQLLLVNLLTDVLPAMAVAVRPPPDTSPAELLAHGPEASLGTSLTRDIQVRAAITATAAAVAWLLARPVSTPGQASTTGLVALVGGQLGQTLAVRGRTPLVAVAVVVSLGLLAATVQLPGLSRIAGSTPLLPHQWAIALTASTAAAAAQLVAQRLLTTG